MPGTSGCLGPASEAKRNSHWRSWLESAAVPVIFILGLWLVVLRPMGPNLASMPGSYVDARFVNYMLEHFTRWLRGLDESYWNAGFFYPYGWTSAFSSNVLGSAPLYTVFRWVGLNRESAFQAWYILSFSLDYAASAYVLARLRFTRLAAGLGAFFFTFGLPAIAQETHPQLAYRFCVPLACYFLWSFYESPRLQKAAALIFFLVWQFYLEIYIGLLLSLLALMMFLFMPLFDTSGWRIRLSAWPNRLQAAWAAAPPREKTTCLLIIFLSVILLAELLIPYYIVYQDYGFLRDTAEIAPFLPRLQSYFLADNSTLWAFLGQLVPPVPQRQEHQLFPGLIVLSLLIAGALFRPAPESNRKLAQLHLAAALSIILLTLDLGGYSLYSLFWRLPGLDSIRAIGRFQLVAMWPLAVYGAWVFDGLTAGLRVSTIWGRVLRLALLAALMMESILYHHTTLAKDDSTVRIARLRQRIPASVPADPVLLVQNPGKPGETMTAEVDAMLLSQDLGWPALNGYSGNFPPGYALPGGCLPSQAASDRIRQYMAFEGISDPRFLSGIESRLVWLDAPECLHQEPP
jgi:hypothetical protein